MFCCNCNQNPIALFQIVLGEEKLVLVARQNSYSEGVEPGLKIWDHETGTSLPS